MAKRRTRRQRPSTPPRPPVGPMLDPGTAAAVPATLAEHPIAEPAIPPSLVAEAEAEPPFAVSTRVVEITPSRLDSPDVWLAGYATSHPEAIGTARSLYARCLVIYDQGSPNVLVTLDVLGVPQSMNEAIRVGVESLGVASSDFLLASTHTHSGPVLVDRLDPYISYALTEADIAKVSQYSDWLVSTVVQLVTDTLAGSRTPVSLAYGVGTAHEAFNREGLPYLDPAVPTLVARDVTDVNRVVAIVFGYACHPVARGFDGRYDADFPGIAQDLLERAFPESVAFFLTGAAGDQNPAGGPQGPVLVNQVGIGVYNGVIAAIESQMTPVIGPLRSDYRTIGVPLDVGLLSTAKRRAAYVARRDADPNGETFAGRHAERMVAAIDDGTLPDEVSLPMQLWTFTGDPLLRIVAIGGELVCGYSVFFKNQFGGNAHTWVTAYANEDPCYIVSQELLVRGGYDAGWDLDPALASTTGSMLFYGWPCRLRGAPDGVEQRVIETMTSMIQAV